jgi:GNAT superfamily N-acetyltransferase
MGSVLDESRARSGLTLAAIVRAITAADRPSWDRLWAGYLEFYKAELTQEQTELTWQRILDDNGGIHGVAAEVDGNVVGIAHFSFTLSTWAMAPDLYLEDLFVDSSVRGQGIGKALILTLSEYAAAEGSRKIWWETHKDNATARRLYDSVGELSEFVKYARAVE